MPIIPNPIATLNIPLTNGTTRFIELIPGDILFAVGANGSGKSSLLHHIYRANYSHAIRLAAHRRTWLESSAPTFSPQSAQTTDTQMRTNATNPEARYRGEYEAQQPMLILSKLLAAENRQSRDFRDTYANHATQGNDSGTLERLRAFDSENPSYLTTISDILREARISADIQLSPDSADFQAVRGASSYGINRMSDGERNAVLLTSEVLIAPTASLFLLDEPELHLHRSIITPLLSAIFLSRPDSAFVISTHEVNMLGDFRGAKVALMRNVVPDGPEAFKWDIDLVDPMSLDSSWTSLSEEITADILGARRKILYVEGTEGSLDKRLYGALFPAVSVVPKGSCREVELAVKGLRGEADHHWVEAFGVVDGDEKSQQEVDSLKSKGIYVLDYNSIESILYHPQLQRIALEAHPAVDGGNLEEVAYEARNAGLQEIMRRQHTILQKVLDRRIHNLFMNQKPSKEDIQGGGLLEFVDIDTERIRRSMVTDLNTIVNSGDFEGYLRKFPLKDRGIRNAIAKKLEYVDSAQYESTVIKIVGREHAAASVVRRLLGDLAEGLSAAP